MWGRRKGPVDTPFDHGSDCKTPAAKPEWGYEGNGRWQRVCTCHTEYAHLDDGKLDPNASATEPAWRAHMHTPSCQGRQIAQVVKVGRYVDGGWRSECLVCGTIQLYWWAPDMTDRDGRPVRRDGSVWYAYETKHVLTETG
jgi:hypothetical protein